MARTVFFSFHYQRDIMRVMTVKNHHITKGNYTTAGYFDGSLEEKAKREGDQAVKNLIDRGLNGSSVLCVLIGNETSTRRWVRYEIQKAVELGMGVFGIRIHGIADPRQGTDYAGKNPFEILGYQTSGNNILPVAYDGNWRATPHLREISRKAAPYLPSQGAPVLSNIFQVHDWVNDRGYDNFASWVEAAARQAGR